ncbi:CDP-alcohol phosphatidyltransferase family protein [Abyssogena phaseoliformis symbiont]|uniref:CDP-alcohol phosphatidyltransferase family protein n=1 Tax=Abyssogena phaseoliformis symbiont TaxID=596095 RepID=UPI001914E9C2|nr:CDP-alcohol phosphatidyltransferase family protein [Abyssogena phaseoliformis symbiont]
MRRFLFKNIANVVSILGVLPLALLYLDDGYQYLLPLIVFNNVMDDLDGILATKLNIKSRFGADLDNVCDAVAHVAITFALGVHFGGVVLIASIVASGAVILRATFRLNPDILGGGSPTNELMRHLLFVLLLANIFHINPDYLLVVVLLFNTISMSSSKKMTAMIRSQAKTASSVILINISLIISLLLPILTPYIAIVFFTTYLYAFFTSKSVSNDA